MNFDNQLLAQQKKSLSAKLIKKEKKTEKWGVWSEGSISFGRIGQQDGNLGPTVFAIQYEDAPVAPSNNDVNTTPSFVLKNKVKVANSKAQRYIPKSSQIKFTS